MVAHVYICKREDAMTSDDNERARLVRVRVCTYHTRY